MRGQGGGHDVDLCVRKRLLCEWRSFISRGNGDRDAERNKSDNKNAETRLQVMRNARQRGTRRIGVKRDM